MSDPHDDYVPPIPIELPTPERSAVARRLIRTLCVGGRHLIPIAGRHLVGRGDVNHSVAHAFRLIFEELGATYVKFGQFVGSAPDIVGDEVAREFRRCLDTGPALAPAVVRAAVEADLGRPLEQVFAYFEDASFAAASVAVVHRARLPSGQSVAVKVLRPGVDQVVAADLAIIQAVVRFLARQGSETAANLVNYLIGLREQVAEELDLCNEARSMLHFRWLFVQLGLTLIVVPRVYEDVSGPRVLTMELLDGVPVDDLARVRTLGADPRPLVQELFRAWVLTSVRHAVFHADIHAGNLLLLRDGRLGMIDWGVVARLDPDTHRLLRRLMEASMGVESAWDDITAHVMRVQGASLRDGLGLSDADIIRLVRALLEPLLLRPIGEVSMAALFGSTEDMITLATGQRPQRRSLIDRFRLLQKTRRAYRLGLEQGYLESDFRRASFLAAKQLVYLERYWKMYLPDQPLLGDREFLESVLAQEDVPG